MMLGLLVSPWACFILTVLLAKAACIQKWGRQKKSKYPRNMHQLRTYAMHILAIFGLAFVVGPLVSHVMGAQQQRWCP